MGAVIGDLLPLAVTIAVSPVPIIAVILMLLAPNAGRTALGFLVGWVAGIIAATALFAWLAAATGMESSGESSAAASWVKLVLGLLLLLLSVKQWRSRPGLGDEAALPGWMNAINKFSAVKTGALGFALAAINPKNLMMCVAAGVTLSSGVISTGQEIVAGSVFTIIATSTVAVPVVAYTCAREAMSGPLHRLKVWLQAENATVMSVLLLVIGAVLFGKGLGGLF